MTGRSTTEIVWAGRVELVRLPNGAGVASWFAIVACRLAGW
jgi:hypothetical protein